MEVKGLSENQRIKNLKVPSGKKVHSAEYNLKNGESAEITFTLENMGEIFSVECIPENGEKNTYVFFAPAGEYVNQDRFLDYVSEK